MKPSHALAYVGPPHATGLIELYCSLTLIPATEDMILRIQVPGWVGAGPTGEIVLKGRSTGATLALKKGVKKVEHTCIGW